MKYFRFLLSVFILFLCTSLYSVSMKTNDMVYNILKILDLEKSLPKNYETLNTEQQYKTCLDLISDPARVLLKDITPDTEVTYEILANLLYAYVNKNGTETDVLKKIQYLSNKKIIPYAKKDEKPDMNVVLFGINEEFQNEKILRFTAQKQSKKFPNAITTTGTVYVEPISGE